MTKEKEEMIAKGLNTDLNEISALMKKLKNESLHPDQG